MANVDYEKELARELLSFGITDDDLSLFPTGAEDALSFNLGIQYPDPTLAPTPKPLLTVPAPSKKLPQADVLVVTWTVDEQRALADVLTPKFGRNKWYRYNRKYADYDAKIRKGAPAKNARRLGSYFPTEIGNTSVLCFK